MRRSAALAGRWYPADPRACRAAVERHTHAEAEPGPYHALIGPHAGWAYSGDVAGKAYRWLAEAQACPPELVVVFGSHRGPRGPDTVFRGTAWETPCGDLVTARVLADRVAAELSVDDEPCRPLRADNAVELHLPFIAHVFPDAELLMVGVAAAPHAIDLGRRVGELVRDDGRPAVFVGSTDLTHYGPDYGFVPVGSGPEAVDWVRHTNDRRFLDAVLDDDPERALADAARHQSACGAGAVAATLAATRACHGGVHPRLIDHTLSYDVRPAPNFVGYAGVVL